jgi:hypothetical protein
MEPSEALTEVFQTGADGLEPSDCRDSKKERSGRSTAVNRTPARFEAGGTSGGDTVKLTGKAGRKN